MATTRILFATELLTIGRFRCDPGDARWRQPNWIGPVHHVVFPGRSVLIDQQGVGSVLADPNHVVLYDAGRTYRRELVSPDGDVATYLAVSDPLVRSLLAVHGDRAPSFGRATVALEPDILLRFRLLLGAIERREVRGLEVEEAVMSILATIVAEPDQPRWANTGRRVSRSSTRRAHEALVLDTKRVLAQHLAEPLTLAQIGRRVGASPFHLARVFRASTGWSLQAYLEQIRLRRALERLTDGGSRPSVGWLARDVGFASHAYFDTRFRRTFGRAPGELRAAAIGRGPGPRMAFAPAAVPELRTIAKGAAAERP